MAGGCAAGGSSVPRGYAVLPLWQCEAIACVLTQIPTGEVYARQEQRPRAGLQRGEACRRPHLIGVLRPQQRLTIRDGNLLAAAARYLQPGLGVQTLDTLVIDPPTLLPELQVNHLGAGAPVPMGHGQDGCART